MQIRSMPQGILRAGVAALIAATALAAGSARASSHREAPSISQYPAPDNTDTYFFVSPTNPSNVVMVGCWWPLEEPSGGPNWFHFDDSIDYNFNLDNDGDAMPDITYTFRFTTQFMNPGTFLYATGPITSLSDPDWNYRQTYSITRIVKGHGPGTVIAQDLVVPPVNIGPRTTPDYATLGAAGVQTVGSMKVFAGQRDDPFFVDLGATFDLVAIRALPGDMGQGVDALAGFNCQAIVLELPISEITRDGSNPTDPASAAAVVGLWASSAAPRNGYGSTPGSPDASYRGNSAAHLRNQVSRLGMPLVNEVVIPLGKKDLFNASQPKDDAQFLSYVTNPELAQNIQTLYGIPAPPTPRCDLVTVFLTGIPGLNQPPDVVASEEMRLNVAIKPDANPDSPFGLLGGDLDGFPNGRRLADDVVDIAERVMEGVVYPLFCDASYTPHPLAGRLGDGVDQNDVPYLADFPYLALPHDGFDNSHYRVEPAHGGGGSADGAGAAGASNGAAARAAVQGARRASMAATMSAGGDAAFDLGRAFPNPTVADTDISFSLPADSRAAIRVFDVRGREVKTLVDGVMSAGVHRVRWDGTDSRGTSVAAGVYFYRLETPAGTADKKLTVLR